MRAAVLLALAVAAFAATAEAAATGAQGELEALFPPNQATCYAMRFDAAWLAAHPDQSVVAIRVMRGYPSLRESDETSGQGEWPSMPAQLIVTFRDTGENATPRQYGAEVECRADREGAPDAKARCVIACDGGGFIPTRDADGAMHFAIEDGRSLRIAGGCTNHREVRVVGTQKGDRIFTLPRQPLEACR
jgi:hypothetical protein